MTIAILLVSCCHIPPVSQELQATKAATWTANLRDPDLDWVFSAHFDPFRQIAFGNNTELVVLGGSGPFQPRRVRTWVLETRKGKVLRKTDWTTDFYSDFIFATSTGKYAIGTEIGMALYSRGLEREITTGANDAKPWSSSPDGRFFAGFKYIPGHRVSFFIDAETLKPTGTEFRDVYIRSVADNRIAYTGRDANGVATVFIEDNDATIWKYHSDCKVVRPSFISNDLLAVVGCNRLDVVSASGEKLFTALLKGERLLFAASSRDGRRFAVMEQFDEIGDPPRLCMERITVFDVRQRKPIFVTDDTDLSGSQGGSSGVALSPDGSSMAVNSAGLVRLFVLPRQ